jgi:hemerythrin superfamily protein
MELDRKATWFHQLRETLVRHEVAEELMVYPVLRRISAAGERTMNTRIEEQKEAEKLLLRLEDMDVRSDGFRDVFLQLRKTVLEHARREEATVFPFIEQEKTLDDRSEMARRFEMAKKLAPTHPHPHAPDNRPGNLIVDPLAALADRIRDAFRAVDL